MRRAYKEVILSLGTVTLVLLVLVGLDQRVRDEFSLRFSAHPTEQLADVGHHAQALSSVVVQAARNHSLAHAPLLIFAFAATVLVIFMLRT